MKKEVSIVLSQERHNYRKLAQEWFGLTDEQMKDCDVHHNPPRSQGGRNIPEHLFVYHYTLHAAVHEALFILTQRKAAVKGGQTAKDKKLGIFDLTPEQEEKRINNLLKVNRETHTGVFIPGLASVGGTAAMSEKDEEGKSIHARKMALVMFEDPDHPELGHQCAGNLVRMQMRRGLPHGKENRRRVQ
jgi:hypothetical protein